MVENIYDDSYFSYAESDFPFFLKACQTGNTTPGMASMGQNMSERYLKHVIDVYSEPTTPREEKRRDDVMRTHSLARLLEYIRNDMEIDVSPEIEDSIVKADSFYFTTRYPGDNSHIATDRDIARAYESVTTARDFVCEIIHERESRDNGLEK